MEEAVWRWAEMIVMKTSLSLVFWPLTSSSSPQRLFVCMESKTQSNTTQARKPQSFQVLHVLCIHMQMLVYRRIYETWTLFGEDAQHQGGEREDKMKSRREKSLISSINIGKISGSMSNHNNQIKLASVAVTFCSSFVFCFFLFQQQQHLCSRDIVGEEIFTITAASETLNQLIENQWSQDFPSKNVFDIWFLSCLITSD